MIPMMGIKIWSTKNKNTFASHRKVAIGPPEKRKTSADDIIITSQSNKKKNHFADFASLIKWFRSWEF